MAGMLALPGDSSRHGIVENSPYRLGRGGREEASRLGASWYFSRKEIEENSPSRRDGIDLKKESNIRKSYCKYLQDLGMKLKVPQVTIATAIVFCHRFFLRQSLANNDRQTIATVCMFLAGKVEETPRPLKDVIMVSYEIIHKKDPAAAQRIKQREVYEQQKELILLGERVVLVTLGFDLNVHHPYKPLVEAIKKFKVAQNALAQVAWNFVNDGLRTSLCLQFKPHHIAAGAIFLAAKFLKVKLPSDGEKVWWQEFDVTPRQLEEVSNQMLELYEQNHVAQPSQGNETEGSSASMVNQRVPIKAQNSTEEPQASKLSSIQHSTSTGAQTHHGSENSYPDEQNETKKMLKNGNNDYVGNKARSGQSESRVEAGTKGSHSQSRVEAGTRDSLHHGQTTLPGNSRSGLESERPLEEQKPLPVYGSPKETILNINEGPNGPSSMMDAMKKIDKDKVKAALEKRRKSKGDVARKVDVMDDDDIIERELEHGVEVAVEDEKIKQERRQNLSHTFSVQQEDHQSADRTTENGHLGKQKVPENSKERELPMDRSPELGSRKRKDGSEYKSQQYHNATKHQDDARLAGQHERVENDLKKHRPNS